MPETLRKRGREPEVLLDSIDVGEPKRFHREEADHLFHLLQLDKTLSDDDEEECFPSEELINGVMRSLEEEIATIRSTSFQPSNSGDNLAAADISSGQEGETRDSDSGIDLCYLLEASDDELGIPPNPVLEVKEKVCQSPNETWDSLLESADLKPLGENWHLEDDFENYQQFAAYGDAWDASQLQDYLNRDFVRQGLLFDADFSAAWSQETAGGM